MKVRSKIVRKTFFTLLHLATIALIGAFSGSCYMENVQPVSPEETVCAGAESDGLIPVQLPRLSLNRVDLFRLF